MKSLVCKLIMVTVILSHIVVYPAKAQTSQTSPIRIDRTRQGLSLSRLGRVVWDSSSEFRGQFETLFNITLTEENFQSVIGNICPRSIAKSQDKLAQTHGLVVREENGLIVIYQLQNPFIIKGGGRAYNGVPAVSLADKQLGASLTLLTLFLSGSEVVKGEMIDYCVNHNNSCSTQDLFEHVGRLMELLFITIIPIASIFIAIAAFQYIMSQDPSPTTSEARSKLVAALIGALMLFASQAILDAVEGVLSNEVFTGNPNRREPGERRYFAPAGHSPYDVIFTPCPPGYNNAGEPTLPSTPGAIDGGTITVTGKDPCK